MKVRKLLKYNQNAAMTITIWDGAECYTYPSRDSLTLKKYMHREVLGWRISSGRDMYISGIVIDLKKEAEHGR